MTDGEGVRNKVRNEGKMEERNSLRINAMDEEQKAEREEGR